MKNIRVTRVEVVPRETQSPVTGLGDRVVSADGRRNFEHLGAVLGDNQFRNVCRNGSRSQCAPKNPGRSPDIARDQNTATGDSKHSGRIDVHIGTYGRIESQAVDADSCQGASEPGRLVGDVVSNSPSRHVVLRSRYQPNHIGSAGGRKIGSGAIIHRRKTRKPQHAIGQRCGCGDPVGGTLNAVWKDEPNRAVIRVGRPGKAAKIQRRLLPGSPIHFNHVRTTFSQGQRSHGLGRSGAIVPLNLKRTAPHIQIRQFPEFHGVAELVIQDQRSRIDGACPGGGQRAVIPPQCDRSSRSELVKSRRSGACQIGINHALIKIHVTEDRKSSRPVDVPGAVQIPVAQVQFGDRLIECIHVEYPSETASINTDAQLIELGGINRI